MNHLNNAARILTIAVVLLTGAAHAQMPGEGKSVQPIVPAGISGVAFQHGVVQLALEKLGYKVKNALEADYPALHLAIAQGQADYTANHWVPVHSSFYEQAGGEAVMDRVGKIVDGAGQGYFIDKVTAGKYKIDNLGQLQSPDIAKLFDSDGDGKADLTGCNPGWGCEREIEKQLDAYKLRDTVKHKQGSYFALIADMITRHEAGQPILFYTWSPQWIGAVLRPGEDVVQLNVPFSASTDGGDTALPDGSNPGFKTNDIVFLANKEFLEANPAVKRLFNEINIPLEDINAMILRQHKGENTSEQVMSQAREWVTEHQAQFDDWVKNAAAAQ